MKTPKTIEERDALLREIVKPSLRDAFVAGWVCGQFSVIPDEQLSEVIEPLNDHECEQAFRRYIGDTD